MRSTIAILLLLSFSLIYGQIAKNGGAYLFPKLNQSISLGEKFNLIRNATEVKKTMSIGFLSRIDKVRLLALWLDGYETPDKYDLLDMFDRMLMIRNRVQSMLFASPIKEDIINLELERDTIMALPGTENQMKYVVDEMRFFPLYDRAMTGSYFHFDFDWQSTFYTATNVLFPAREAFYDFFFSKSVFQILDNKNMTDKEKLDSLDYGKGNLTKEGKASMVKLYQTYLNRTDGRSMDQ